MKTASKISPNRLTLSVRYYMGRDRGQIQTSRVECRLRPEGQVCHPISREDAARILRAWRSQGRSIIRTAIQL